MRAFLVLASLLSVSLLPMLAVTGPASAQATPPVPEGPTTLIVLEDAAGDNSVRPADQPTPVAPWPHSDLVSLTVSEQPRDFTFVLKVAGLGDQDEPLADTAAYWMEFTAGGAAYRARAVYQPDNGGTAAFLQSRDGDRDFYRGSEPLNASVDVAAATVTVGIPRSLVPNLDGAPLLKGEVLDGFAVTAATVGDNLVRGLSYGTTTTGDAMPDSGTGTIKWVVRHGGSQAGTVFAAIKQPVRVSNGEATTFLYEVTVHNRATRPDTIEVRANTTPPLWTLTFPQKEVRIDAEGKAEVPVLVTVPFNHVHGRYESANLTFQSRSDPLSRGSAEIGIRYTKVPQPAGHHNMLYWHSGNGAPFVNTLDNDTIPGDEQQSTPSSWTCSFSGGGASGQGRNVPLVPDLDLGIDVDLEAVGEATVTVQSSAPSPGLHSIGGFVVVWYGDQMPSSCAHEPPEEAVMVIERSAPLELEANTPLQVKLPITPLAYGDRLEHEGDIHMGLVWVVFNDVETPFTGLGGLTGLTGVSTSPVILDGSVFRLPLSEYHDKVNQYFAALSGVELYTTGEQQLQVNPGKTAIFEVNAEMVGEQGADFALELAGLNTEWARIVGATTISLGPRETKTITVAVTPPATASPLTVADLTLHAVKQGDDNVRSLIRLLATVTTEADVPDQASRVADLDGQQKSSPGPAALMVGGALLLAMVVRRSRR